VVSRGPWVSCRAFDEAFDVVPSPGDCFEEFSLIGFLGHIPHVGVHQKPFEIA